MKALNKRLSTFRKVAVTCLFALLLLCGAMFALAQSNKKADATEWGTFAISPDGAQAWSWWDNNGGNYIPASTYGTMFNIEIAQASILNEHRFMDMSVSPTNSMLWLGAGDVFANEPQGSGRFLLRFMFNMDNKGIYVFIYLPNGGTGVNYLMNVANGIWPDAGYGSPFNLSLRIIQVNGVWDLYINDHSVNGELGNAFSTYVGGAAVAANNGVNYTVSNPQSATTKQYYVATGTSRAITDEEIVDLQSRFKMMSAYAAGITSYYGAAGELKTFSAFGGYFDLNLDVRNRPWTGYWSQFQVGFSHDATVPFDYNDTNIDGSRFYFNFMINPNGVLYVAPHFEYSTGDVNDWAEVTSYDAAPIRLRFAFMARSGGWGLYIIANDSIVLDYTTQFIAKVNQNTFMADIGTSAPKINIGTRGNQNMGFCNYADIYFVNGAEFNGYETRVNQSALMEVVIASPATKTSYYDDAKPIAQGKSFIDIPANTAFDVSFNVELAAALTSEQKFYVSFGPDAVVMDNNASRTDTGANHFMVAVSVNTDGIMRAQILYNDLNGNAVKPLNDISLGNAGAFANLAGAQFGVTIGFHKVNTATSADNYWGIYLNGQLLDVINFAYIIHRAGTGFMEGANKNIAILVDSSNGFGTFPGNIYLTGIFTVAQTATATGTVVSVADLKTVAGTDVFADSVSLNKNTAYYYNATSATESNDVIFKTTINYVKNDNYEYTIMLRTVTDQENGVPTFVIRNNVLYLGSINSNGSQSTFIMRSAPLTGGVNYEIDFAALTVSNDTSKTLLSARIIEVNSGTVRAAAECVYELSKSADYGVVLGAGGTTAVTFNSLSHRVKFTDKTGATEISSARYLDGETGAAAPASTLAPSVTNYTFRGWEDDSHVAYVAGSPVKATKTYKAAYNFTATSLITAEINTKQVKYAPTSQIWLRNGQVGAAIMFINNLSNSFYEYLDGQVANGNITSYKVGTLITNKTLTELTMVVGASGVAKYESTGYFLNDSAKDAKVRYIASGIYNIPSANYGTTLTSRVYVEITQTNGEVVYAYGTFNRGSLSNAAKIAIEQDAVYYTPAQRTAISAFIVG
ncbi:MAG: hypothetical protein SPL13_02525 [Clostridia bacterium]|nr:hypothetical protein [Clostridia bacterium]